MKLFALVAAALNVAAAAAASEEDPVARGIRSFVPKSIAGELEELAHAKYVKTGSKLQPGSNDHCKAETSSDASRHCNQKCEEFCTVTNDYDNWECDDRASADVGLRASLGPGSDDVCICYDRGSAPSADEVTEYCSKSNDVGTKRGKYIKAGSKLQPSGSKDTCRAASGDAKNCEKDCEKYCTKDLSYDDWECDDSASADVSLRASLKGGSKDECVCFDGNSPSGNSKNSKDYDECDDTKKSSDVAAEE